jgi:hypothetical protein
MFYIITALYYLINCKNEETFWPLFYRNHCGAQHTAGKRYFL